MHTHFETAIFRFAPSPNGHLHLGHAYSALLNQQLCDKMGGKMLLRIEDIDGERCTSALEAQMLDDLKWLGIKWQSPVMRQSEQFERYQSALDDLMDAGLLYPASLSRGAVKREVMRFEETGQIWPRDPDGSPHYPQDERNRSLDEMAEIIAQDAPFSLRLNMTRALKHIGRKTITWQEDGKTIEADPSLWGDVVLARKDTPASYHLCVVLDDALQKISHVVRGCDLYHASGVHRLLQELLGLPEPQYFHHELLLDNFGKKLSKSERYPQLLSDEFKRFASSNASLFQLRKSGATPKDVAKMVGL